MAKTYSRLEESLLEGAKTEENAVAERISFRKLVSGIYCTLRAFYTYFEC
jgi:hypothetical protein